MDRPESISQRKTVNIAPAGLPQRLRAARLAKHLTMRQLANIAGCSAQALSLLERGALEPLALIHRLALSLGVNPRELAFGDEK